MSTLTAEYPQHFSVIDGREWTAWTMRDGNTMAGKLVRHCIGIDGYTVLRVDGSTCHVPKSACRPATCDDIESACEFYRTLGK